MQPSVLLLLLLLQLLLLPFQMRRIFQLTCDLVTLPAVTTAAASCQYRCRIHTPSYTISSANFLTSAARPLRLYQRRQRLHEKETTTAIDIASVCTTTTATAALATY